MLPTKICCGVFSRRSTAIILRLVLLLVLASYPESDGEKNKGESRSRDVEHDQSPISESQRSYDTGQSHQRGQTATVSEAPLN
jgi:hypothetical protein